MDQFQGLTSLGTRDILITHCLVYGATIQLHKNFASRNANSNQKCLGAASAVVVILNRANLSDIVYLNPIIGVRALIIWNTVAAEPNLQTLWMAVCQVFIAEVLRLRTLRSSWTSEFPVRDEVQLIASIQSVMTTMAMFGRNCPITSKLFPLSDVSLILTPQQTINFLKYETHTPVFEYHFSHKTFLSAQSVTVV
jgi:hypothetical protein